MTKHRPPVKPEMVSLRDCGSNIKDGRDESAISRYRNNPDVTPSLKPEKISRCESLVKVSRVEIVIFIAILLHLIMGVIR